jgi:thiamine kinase-like enzyme
MKCLPLCLALILTWTLPTLAQKPSAPPATKEVYEAAGDKLLKKLEEFATLLETAQDPASAQIAKTKLDKVNKEIAELSAAAAALGEPPPAIKAVLDQDKKMQDRAQGFMTKLITQSRRIAEKPELLALLQQTMRDFQKVSQPAKPAAPPAAK